MSAFDPKRTSVGLSPGEAARAVNWRRVNRILVRFVPMLPGQAFSFEKRTCHCRGARCDICIGALVLKTLFTRLFQTLRFMRTSE